MTRAVMSDCDTWQAATARRELPYDEPIWDDDLPADTHIAAELLSDPVARAFVESRYEIGKPCSRRHGVAAFHAHLRPTEPRAELHAARVRRDEHPEIKETP